MSEPPMIVVREPGRSPLYVVLTQRLEVGRGGSGLLLDDPSVSRRHLELRPEGGEVVVTDLGSVNGTTIDDDPVTDAVPLAPGAVIRLGDTTIERVTGILQVGVRAAPLEGATSIERVAVAAAREHPRPSIDWGEGTVTIVFSDIESSAELARKLGDAHWFRLLGAHNDIVRRHVAAHGGVEVKAQGDGFMLAFTSARRAVMCAIGIERAMAHMSEHEPDHPIRVRFGAHTGEVIVGDDGDLFGHHVNVAARIADQADGGEILVSSLVREIVEARGDLEFGRPRSVRLKGLGDTWLLHPVMWEDGPTSGDDEPASI